MNYVEFVEKIYGIKLLDYQKELLFRIEALLKTDERYILLAQRCSPFTSILYYIMSTLYGTRVPEVRDE